MTCNSKIWATAEQLHFHISALCMRYAYEVITQVILTSFIHLGCNDCTLFPPAGPESLCTPSNCNLTDSVAGGNISGQTDKNRSTWAPPHAFKVPLRRSADVNNLFDMHMKTDVGLLCSVAACCRLHLIKSCESRRGLRRASSLWQRVSLKLEVGGMKSARVTRPWRGVHRLNKEVNEGYEYNKSNTSTSKSNKSKTKISASRVLSPWLLWNCLLASCLAASAACWMQRRNETVRLNMRRRLVRERWHAAHMLIAKREEKNCWRQSVCSNSEFSRHRLWNLGSSSAPRHETTPTI